MDMFKNRLKEQRIAKKLTQSQLAQILGVDQRSISNWEQGVREPSLSMLTQIAKFFDVSADFLLGLKDFY